jgi:hypothetical protein
VEEIKAYYTKRLADQSAAFRKYVQGQHGSIHDESDSVLAGDSDNSDDGEASVGDGTDANDDLYPDGGGDYGEDTLADGTPFSPVHIAEHERRSVDSAAITVSGGGIKDAIPDRDLSGPYAIDLEDFCNAPEGQQQITITYYASDKVLVDDQNNPIPDIVGNVGQLSALDFGGISQDPHIRYVRNERIDVDFEIILHSGSFAQEVLHYGRPDPEE